MPTTRPTHTSSDLNNRLTNLSWGTHSENQFDQVAHGTHHHAAKDRCPAGHAYDAANTYIFRSEQPPDESVVGNALGEPVRSGRARNAPPRSEGPLPGWPCLRRGQHIHLPI